MKIYKKNEINELAEILKNDGIISVPTDTIYGFCVRINSEKAYQKLVTIKKRSSNKIFPIMCANKEQIKSIAYVDDKIEKLINAFMPGPITLVLKKKAEVTSYINNKGDTEFHELAVRMATSKELEKLINKIECPILITSANISNEEVCKNAEEIATKFPELDGILEGETHYGKASTIIDCTKEEISIQRLGPITQEQIDNVLNS